jgi:Zn-dependent metalloprotease
MNKISYLILLSSFITISLSAQVGEKKAPTKRERPAPERLLLRPEAKRNLPIAENPFGFLDVKYAPIGTLQTPDNRAANISIERDEDGTPICYRGTTEASKSIADNATTPAQAALAYISSLQMEGIEAAENEFVVSKVQTDEQGNKHIRMEQRWNDVPVYGSEIIAHTKNGAFHMLNGRYVPSPKIAASAPAISADQAIELVKNDIGIDKVKTNWSATDLTIIGASTPFQTDLVIYPYNGTYRYTWHIIAHPNLMVRKVYIIDAQTGAVLNQYDQTCRLLSHVAEHLHGTEADAHTCTHDHPIAEDQEGPVTGTGVDLLGVSRSFGAWQDGSTVFMLDASQPMFNTTSQMPNNPIGAIITLDAKNTSPQVQSSFDYQDVKSNSTAFNNPTAVSAHWNSIKSYQYFKNKFNRNSIDDNGGNIISFINVSEDDGSSMENAFWNGAYMWYGNGGSTFRRLARGLDVGGHEMTHGVVEKTANLEYQGESGALNESFADIFGAMIDPGDWLIGEDVMQPNTHTCLRDMSNPNNGVSTNSPFWQPAHMNEKYNGTQNNGGVHINSGIVNKAYHLFATTSGVGTDKAEQVYYKALRDILVKSSKFVDCRLAIIQAATDLYGTTVANAAANAFSQVGIGGSAPSGNFLGQLSQNPGVALILCESDDESSIALADANGNVLGIVYNEVGILSRPSVSDNGISAIFVNKEKHLILIDFTYTNGQINLQTTQLSQSAEWRNAAISKDGRFVAAITDAEDNNMYVYDLLSPTLASETFTLVNPTYTAGQSTSNVLYADVMEFDYSGDYIMYDAFNELSNTQGQSFSYWDISFVKFWENNQFTDGSNAQVSKLFNGLPESVSIGNPTFAKNSPFIIAFDYKDDNDNEYNILGANSETGDYDVIASNIGTWGWPNYDKEDKSILHNKNNNFGGFNLVKQGVASSKIKGQGTAQTWVTSHAYGVWYANGTRSLAVNTKEHNAANSMSLSASPNPTTSNVRMQFSTELVADMQVVVTNILGAVVHTYTVQTAQGINYFDLDMSDLPAGTYVVRLESPAGFGAVKVMKQ